MDHKSQWMTEYEDMQKRSRSTRSLILARNLARVTDALVASAKLSCVPPALHVLLSTEKRFSRSFDFGREFLAGTRDRCVTRDVLTSPNARVLVTCSTRFAARPTVSSWCYGKSVSLSPRDEHVCTLTEIS